MAQSVSIEPGVSLFNNSNSGTEIRAEHTRPLKISSEGHLAPIDFYNYTQLHGRIRTSYTSMQIHGRNGVLLFPTIDSTLGPKFNLNASGKLVLADNAYMGLYRLNVLENDENVAFFGNTNIDGKSTVNLNNKAYLTTDASNLRIIGNSSVHIETNTNSALRYRSDNKDRLVINGSNGYTGIGVSTPKYPLHVEAREDTIAKFRNVLNNFSQILIHEQLALSAGRINTDTGLEDYAAMHSAGLLYIQSKKQQNFNVNSKNNMRLDADGNVTIRPIYNGTGFDAAKATLDVGGTIRSFSLDFDEVGQLERRPVFANKDGVLILGGASTQYLSYNFSQVQAQNWDDQLRRGSGFAWFNTTTTGGTMYLPVNLPDGVRVTNVRMYVVDNSASDISFIFSRNTHTTNTFTTIASATSSGANANIRSINQDTSETISNLNNTYYINISSVGNWTGNTLQFHSLLITYQYL
jgi:hypothetical protein